MPISFSIGGIILSVEEGGGARDVAHEAEKGGTCSARVGFYVSSGESPRKIAASSRPFVE